MPSKTALQFTSREGIREFMSSSPLFKREYKEQPVKFLLTIDTVDTKTGILGGIFVKGRVTHGEILSKTPVDIFCPRARLRGILGYIFRYDPEEDSDVERVQLKSASAGEEIICNITFGQSWPNDVLKSAKYVQSRTTWPLVPGSYVNKDMVDSFQIDHSSKLDEALILVWDNILTGDWAKGVKLCDSVLSFLEGQKNTSEGRKNYENIQRDTMFFKGLLLEKAGNTVEAEECYEKVTNLAEQWGILGRFFLGGNESHIIDDPETASIFLTRAVKINPQDFETWFLLAKVRESLGYLSDECYRNITVSGILMMNRRKALFLMASIIQLFILFLLLALQKIYPNQFLTDALRVFGVGWCISFAYFWFTRGNFIELLSKKLKLMIS